MSYRLIIKSEAEQDLVQAALWYNEQRIGLGEEFLKVVGEKIKVIAENPYLFEVRYMEVRHAFIRRFPFAVHYLIEDKNIFVLAILHTSCNPKVWEKR